MRTGWEKKQSECKAPFQLMCYIQCAHPLLCQRCNIRNSILAHERCTHTTRSKKQNKTHRHCIALWRSASENIFILWFPRSHKTHKFAFGHCTCTKLHQQQQHRHNEKMSEQERKRKWGIYSDEPSKMVVVGNKTPNSNKQIATPFQFHRLPVANFYWVNAGNAWAK